MATKTWTGGTGSYAVGTNWTGGVVPLAGDTGVFSAGTIQIGGIAIQPTTTLVIGNGDQTNVLDTQLTNTTLNGAFLTPAGGANGDVEVYDIGGTVTLNGRIAGSQAFGLMNFNDLAGPGTLVVSNTATISSLGADINIAVSTLVDNGEISLTDATAFVSSATVSGTGSFTMGGPGIQIQTTFVHAVGSGIRVLFKPATAALLELSDPTHFAATISGLNKTDVIQLDNVQADAAVLSAGTLTVTNAGVLVAKLNVGGAYPAGFTVNHTGFFGAPDALDSFIRAVACFATGTRIQAKRGEVAVQALRVGDRVVTLDGKHAAVVWLGHRRTDCRRHPRPWDVWPVRVHAGAFGDGLPRRDLLLSPDHAVFVNNALIPVRYLINDATIVQEPAGVITYWHVELERHDVLLAEGLPAESYLDTGNRAAFENGGAVVEMHPAFARAAWENHACAKLVLEGPALVDARAALLRRAFRLGYATSAEAALTLRAGGQILMPHCAQARVFTFDLPSGTRTVRLQSRDAVPGHVKVSDPDNRRLGVAVSRLALDDVNIPLTDTRLGDGWLPAEDRYRWTDGNGAIATKGARRLSVQTLPLLRYWTPPDAGRSQKQNG